MDVFERYWEFVEKDTTTDKEKLLKSFKLFLENPKAYGFFAVRWKEDDTMYNNESMQEIANNWRY